MPAYKSAHGRVFLRLRIFSTFGGSILFQEVVPVWFRAETQVLPMSLLAFPCCPQSALFAFWGSITDLLINNSTNLKQLLLMINTLPLFNRT